MIKKQQTHEKAQADEYYKDLECMLHFHEDPHHQYETHDAHSPWQADHSRLIRSIPDYEHMHYTMTHPVSEQDT